MFLFIAFHTILKRSLNQTSLVPKKSWDSMKGWMAPLTIHEFKKCLGSPDLRSLPCQQLFPTIFSVLQNKALRMLAVFWDHQDYNLAEQRWPDMLIQFWRYASGHLRPLRLKHPCSPGLHRTQSFLLTPIFYFRPNSSSGPNPSA